MSALSCPQQFVGVATGRDALQDALPRGTSKKGANLKTEKLMGKSLSSDSARAVRRSSKKERRDVQRRTRGSASLPAPAKWLGPIISTVHTVRSWAEREEAEWGAWSAWKHNGRKPQHGESIPVRVCALPKPKLRN